MSSAPRLPRPLPRPPEHFRCGVAVIVLCVFLLSALLVERNYGLWIGTQAGFQGGAHLILYRLCHRRAQSRED